MDIFQALLMGNIFKLNAGWNGLVRILLVPKNLSVSTISSEHMKLLNIKNSKSRNKNISTRKFKKSRGNPELFFCFTCHIIASSGYRNVC